MIVDKPIGLLELQSKHMQLFSAITTHESNLANTHNSMTILQIENRKVFINELALKLNFVEMQKKNTECYTCAKRMDCFEDCGQLQK